MLNFYDLDISKTIHRCIINTVTIINDKNAAIIIDIHKIQLIYNIDMKYYNEST